MNRIFAFLFLLLSLALPLRAWAHPADEDYTLTTTCDLFDDHLEQTVYIPTWFLLSELYGDDITLKSLVGKEKECQAQIAGWMAYNNPICFDGVAVKAEIVKLEARSSNWTQNKIFPSFAADDPTDDALLKHQTGVKMSLRYIFKQKPKDVSVRWRRYIVRTIENGALSQPPVSLAFFYGDKHRLVELTPIEPEWIWHSLAITSPPSAMVSAKWEPKQVHVPVGALIVLFGACALLLRKRIPRVSKGAKTLSPLRILSSPCLRAGFFLVALGASACAWHFDIGSVAINSPFNKTLARPNQTESQIILRSLVQGIYKSFDYNQDSDIYDALAVCVDGPLLEKTYADIRSSLVLDDKEGGGAICQVEKVEITQAELLPLQEGEKENTLHLSCTWTVRGKVSHWGHTHTRGNEYQAVYTLTAREDKAGLRWKVVGCEVNMQKAVEGK